MNMLIVNKITYFVDKQIISQNSRYFSALFETDPNVDIDLDIDDKMMLNFICLMSNETDFKFNTSHIDTFAYWYMYFAINDALLPAIKSKIHIEITPEIIQGIYRLNKSVFRNIFGVFDLDEIFQDSKLDDNYMSLMKRVKLPLENYLELFGLWKKWIIPETKINDMLLFKLYDYVNYLKYTPTKVKLESKCKFRQDESVVNLEFVQRFENLTFGILRDFDYKDVIVAGGSVHHCVINRKLASADVDIFVYSHDAFERTLGFFNARFRGNIYYAVNGCVVTLCIVGIQRNFQIIYSSCQSKYDIIGYFDFGYCQMLYDGKNVLCTDNCLTSLRTQTTSISSSYALATTPNYRYYKTYLKGYGIDTDKTLDEIKNEKLDLIQQNKYYYPMAINDREKFLIRAVFDAENVYTDYKQVLKDNRYIGISNFTNYRSIKIVDWDALYDSIKIANDNIVASPENKMIMIKVYSSTFQLVSDDRKTYLYMKCDDAKMIEFFYKLEQLSLQHVKKITNRDDFKISSCIHSGLLADIKNTLSIHAQYVDNYASEGGIPLEFKKIYSGYVYFCISNIWKRTNDITITCKLQYVDIKCERKIIQNISRTMYSGDYPFYTTK